MRRRVGAGRERFCRCSLGLRWLVDGGGGMGEARRWTGLLLPQMVQELLKKAE